MNQMNSNINDEEIKLDNKYDNKNNNKFGGMATYNSNRVISKSQKESSQYKSSNYSSPCQSSSESLIKNYYDNKYYEESSLSSYDFHYKHKCNEKTKNELKNSNCFNYELQQEEQYSNDDGDDNNQLNFKKFKLDNDNSKNNNQHSNSSSDYDFSSSCHNNKNLIKDNHISSPVDNTMTIENLLVQLKNSNNNN